MNVLLALYIKSFSNRRQSRQDVLKNGEPILCRATVRFNGGSTAKRWKAKSKCEINEINKN